VAFRQISHSGPAGNTINFFCGANSRYSIWRDKKRAHHLSLFSFSHQVLSILMKFCEEERERESGVRHLPHSMRARARDQSATQRESGGSAAEVESCLFPSSFDWFSVAPAAPGLQYQSDSSSHFHGNVAHRLSDFWSWCVTPTRTKTHYDTCFNFTFEIAGVTFVF
jgi:hypothetical protein